MKILMLLRSSLDNDSRVKKEIHSLKECGYQVTIISVNSSNDSNSKNSHIHRWEAKRRIFPGISAILAFYSFFAFSMKKYKNHSVIHCHDLNTLPVAVLIKTFNYKKKIAIIYDTHELAIDDVPSESRIKKFFKYLIERFFIRFCSKVVCVGDLIGQKYVELYKIKPPSIILNCPPLETSFNNYANKKNYFREKYKINASQKIFIYQGLLNEGRCIRMWLDVFKNFNHDDPVIVFMGYGKLKKDIERHQAQSKNIFYHSTVPQDLILDYSSSADIGISCFEGNLSESLRLSLPNKFFEYMMAGLPVVVSNGPEMVKIIEDYEVGYVLSSNNVTDATNLVKNISNKNLKFHAKNLVDASLIFNWENQSKVLLNLYNELKH